MFFYCSAVHRQRQDVQLFKACECTDLRVQIADQQDIVSPRGSEAWEAEPAGSRCCSRHAAVANTQGRQGTGNTRHRQTCQQQKRNFDLIY